MSRPHELDQPVHQPSRRGLFMLFLAGEAVVAGMLLAIYFFN